MALLSHEETIMADQMHWSADTAHFTDLGSDLFNSNEFESGTFGGVEGKLHFGVIFMVVAVGFLKENGTSKLVTAQSFSSATQM